MASIYGSYNRDWRLRMDYNISQNIAANASTISMVLYIYDGTGYSQNESSGEAYYIIQGEKRWSPYYYGSTGWYTLGSKTITVAHNADGTGSVTLSGEWDCGFDSSYTPRHLTVSGTVTLPTIPRVSSLAFGQFTLGRSGRISIRREAGGFTDTLTYTFGKASGTIANKINAGYVDWTPPAELANQIPNAPSGAGEIVLTTYNGSTAIGSKRYPFTATSPADAAPSIKATLADAGRGVELVGAFVQHQSRLRVQLAGTAKYGASIKSYSATVGGTPSSAQTATFELPTSGQIKVAYSCTDSRGKLVSGSQTITVLPWDAPGVTAITAVRCTAKGVEDPVGDHAKVTFSARVAPLGNKNSATYQVKYRKPSGATWSTAAVPDAEGQYSPIGVTVVIPAPPSDGLEIYVAAKDLYKQTDSLIVTMSSAEAFFRTNAAMTGITWGEEKVDDNVFRVGGRMRFVAKSAKFEGPVRMEGNSISGLSTPKEACDACTKEYVDHRATLKGCKMVLIGNSYADGVGGIGKGWPHYLRDYTGADCDIIHQNGGDFGVQGNANASYPNMTYQEALKEYVTTKTQPEREAVNYVIFGGGWNDAHARLDTLDNAVFDCLTYVQQQFPNALVYVFPLHNNMPFVSMSYYNALRVWCNEAAHAGVGTTENSIYWFYGRPSLCNEDGIHLNDAGYRTCAKYILSSLRGYSFEFSPIPGSGFKQVSGATMSVRTFRSADGLVNLQGAVQFNSGIVRNMRIIEDVGLMFRPGRTLYATAFFFGSDDTHKFAAPICISKDGWVELRSAGHEYSTSGTVYLNSAWQAGI